MKILLLIAAVVALVVASPTCGACLFNNQYACVNGLHTICVDIPEEGEATCPMPSMDLITDIDDCPVEDPECDPFVDPSPVPCCETEGVSCECTCEQVVTPLPFCYVEPTETRTGGVVFTYEATEDATIPVDECYNFVEGLVDAGQPIDFVADNDEPAFYVNFPIGRTYVSWTVGDFTATVDHTNPPVGLETCDTYCTGDCETCSMSAEEYGIYCIWCPDMESDDPATDGECLANFGPETPEEVCEEARYGEDPDCLFPISGPVCPTIEECGECADAEGCVWCNADCGCVYEAEADVECLQYDVDGVLVEDSADCRLTDAADYVDICSDIDNREALLALYESTNGDAWTNNDGWDDEDICNFYGVDCAGKVLDLSNNNLEGVIPEEFFCIDAFQTINLNDNTLMGCIPESIGSLTGAQYMNLSVNELTCDIPVTIALTLKDSLQYFYIQWNRLGCEIPETFCELIFLKEFHLEINELTGIIPECIMTPEPFGQLFEAHFECNGLEEPYEGYIEALRAGMALYEGTIYSVPDPQGGQYWDTELKVWVECPVYDEP